MVKIRLQRFGANKAPFYRIVVTESKNPRDGRFIEIIGLYHPTSKQEHFRVDEEKALKWLAEGAQPTDTVKSIFKKLGINAKHLEKK